MNLLLTELGQALAARTHAVLVLDRAGWHLNEALQIPGNVTLVHLPSHAPEFNPVKKVWQYLRDRWLRHLVLPDYRAVLDAACQTLEQRNRACAESSASWASVRPFPFSSKVSVAWSTGAMTVPGW